MENIFGHKRNMGYLILTREQLLRQGKCCGNVCKNCPYNKKYQKGSTKIKKLK
jgi:hypothetical protein